MARDVRRPGRWDDDCRTPRPCGFVDGDRVIGDVSGDAHERALDRSEQIEGGGRINSICGCAAGKARPGIALALQHAIRPDRTVTVFVGADLEATARARCYFTGYAPLSPSIGLLRDGQLVWMLERRQIEHQGPEQIATALTAAFETFCGSTLEP